MRVVPPTSASTRHHCQYLTLPSFISLSLSTTHNTTPPPPSLSLSPPHYPPHTHTCLYPPTLTLPHCQSLPLPPFSLSSFPTPHPILLTLSPKHAPSLSAA